MTSIAYCTILARNYLPKALALAESLRRHEGEFPLTIFLIDATASTELPDLPGVRWMHPGDLDLPDRAALELAMSYDLVEFATAVKPLVLMKLLAEHEQVAYLDPDTFVTSPMAELSPALESGSGIVLTPHYLQPAPHGGEFSEGHLLHVGVYNLGFCAVSRQAMPFLEWWWDHLRTECLHDPIAGLFVDQKWVDVGSVLFGATSLRHYGYNVSVANLHERPVDVDADGYFIASSGDRLRLFHFHAFDPDRPEELSTRSDESTAHLRTANPALDTLCKEYAGIVVEKRELLGPQPPYVYNSDSTGRKITRRMRHAYRVAVQAAPGTVPSPFVAAEAAEYERWRRSAWKLAGRLMFSDVVKGVRYALPEEYENLKRKLPGVTRRLRGRYLENTGMWG
jgi:hypothetical protein